MLFNITDSDRFGSTLSAKKVRRDPSESVGFDFMGSDLPEGEPLGTGLEQGLQERERDSIEAQLLLGDRGSQEICEMFTVGLFRAVETIEQFKAVEGIVVQMNLKLMRSKDRKLQQERTRQIIGEIKERLR